MSRTLIYGYFEGLPAVYEKDSGGVAWWFNEGKWSEAPGPDVYVGMKVMTKAAFKKAFPDVTSDPPSE